MAFNDPINDGYIFASLPAGAISSDWEALQRQELEDTPAEMEEAELRRLVGPGDLRTWKEWMRAFSRFAVVSSFSCCWDERAGWADCAGVGAVLGTGYEAG
jgi:hypothetical protein